MHLDLKLSDLSPNVGEAALRLPLAGLMRLTERNEQKWGRGASSPTGESRKEKLRQRLQVASNPRKELTSILKAEVGSLPLLLNLYLEFHGNQWLPPFDDSVAGEILSGISTWNRHRRRQAARLFFEKFEELPAVSLLASQLRSAYADGQTVSGDQEKAWVRERNIIFHADGPLRTAQGVRNGETLPQLMERHGIPAKGGFAVKLRQVYLIESLKRCPLGHEPEALREIEMERNKSAGSNLLLGAAALREMIIRVEREGRGQWPESWQKWIIRLGCDPRLGRHTAEGARWWGWATDSQWELAVQGMIGWNLDIFFDFLTGTVSTHQWMERRNFLVKLLKSGRIRDARIALNTRSIALMPKAMRDSTNLATLSSTTEDTCIIGLRCTDDFYLLEGTHSFSLRGFHRSFPVKGFWDLRRKVFTDEELRVPRAQCHIYRPHIGDWVWYFLRDLREDLHIEWRI